MSKQFLCRAFRYATIALFLAAGFEGLKQFIFPGLSIWRLHIAAILFCAFGGAVLSVMSLGREHALSASQGAEYGRCKTTAVLAVLTNRA
jgi:hypothetical protein